MRHLLSLGLLLAGNAAAAEAARSLLAAAAAGQPVRLPAGRIELAAHERIVSTNGLELIGQPGTVLVRKWDGKFDGRNRPAWLDVTGGLVTIRDVTITTDPPIVATGKLLADGRVEPLPGSVAHDGMLAFLMGAADPVAGHILYGRYTYSTKSQAWQRNADGTLTVRGVSFGKLPAGSTVYWFPGNAAGTQISLRNVPSVTLERVNIEQSTGFAVMVRDVTGDVTLRHVTIAPPAGQVAAVPRDGVHLAQVAGNVTFEGCRFGGMQDDAINVHGTYCLVKQRVDARTLRLHPIRGLRYRYGPPGYKGHLAQLPAGTTLRFLDDKARVAHEAVVASWKAEGLEAVLGFDADLPAWIKPDTWIEPAGWLPKRTVIRDCTFADLVGRGIKLSAHDAVVENCRFLRTTAPGLHIGGEFDWWEATMPRRVTVRGCTFERNAWQQNFIRQAALTIQGKELPAGALPMGEIVIENCRFTDQPHDAIVVDGADGVTVRGCQFENIRGERLRGIRGRSAHLEIQ